MFSLQGELITCWKGLIWSRKSELVIQRLSPDREVFVWWVVQTCAMNLEKEMIIIWELGWSWKVDHLALAAYNRGQSNYDADKVKIYLLLTRKQLLRSAGFMKLSGTPTHPASLLLVCPRSFFLMVQKDCWSSHHHTHLPDTEMGEGVKNAILLFFCGASSSCTPERKEDL